MVTVSHRPVRLGSRRDCGRWSPAREIRGKDAVPIIIFLLLVILIAQIGFWDTLGAVLGAAAMIVLFVLLAGALLVLAGLFLVQRRRRRF